MSEVVGKITEAVALLCSKEWNKWQGDPRWLMWLSSTGGTQGQKVLREEFEERLREGDTDWIESLGRAAADSKTPKLFTREYQVFQCVAKMTKENDQVPTTSKVAEELGVSLKTVQRAYVKLAEQSGLELDGRGAFCITG